MILPYFCYTSMMCAPFVGPGTQQAEQPLRLSCAAC